MLAFFMPNVTLSTMSGEFNLIEKYFVGRQASRKDVLLAAGDDCALVKAVSYTHLTLPTTVDV